MNSWMDLAMRVQSIAQAGLAYGKNEYDLERYEELRDIAAQMVAINTDIPCLLYTSPSPRDRG